MDKALSKIYEKLGAVSRTHAVALASSQGLDTSQTARKIGTTRNTVSVSLNRAKRKLGTNDLDKAITRAKPYGFLDQVA